MNIHQKLGILGGGQLSMMLIQKAQCLGLQARHLSTSKQDPANLVSGAGVLGDPKNAADLSEFVAGLDVLSFESEFFDAALLRKTLSSFKGFIFPSLDCLALLQDRKSQKASYLEHKLQTSPFIYANSVDELKDFFRAMGRDGIVAKQRWNGYDGYGTTLIRSGKDLDLFLEKNSGLLDQFIFEKLIRFDYEVALQAARSRAGQVVFFPLVKTTQKDNKCFLVEGPEKVSPAVTALKKKIQKYLNAIDYVGVMGLEFFKTSSGFILNEVAPRVHNTGHHTLDSCNVDQFTMHWLCALQDKLPEVELKSKAFVMLNILGESTGEVQIPDRISGSGALLWYGKSNRPGRKLGHVNYTGDNKKELTAKALKELKLWKL